ncbi:MAG: Lacal_2735 family protein [Cyclobacteriaceae bacterium]
MLNLFKKTTEKERLNKQYQKLLHESYKLSHSNRKAADAKMAEAEEVGKKLSELRD